MDNRQAALGTCERGVVGLGRQSLEAKELQYECHLLLVWFQSSQGARRGGFGDQPRRCLSLQPLFSGGLAKTRGESLCSRLSFLHISFLVPS